MIKIEDADLVSLLPRYIADSVDTQSISYAYKMAMQKMIAFSKMSVLYGNINELPDNILDLLAIELNVQYYIETMSLTSKRVAIKKALSWYMLGGTVQAVTEMVENVLGSGNVVEWFEYGADPGYFYIDTDEELSDDSISKFNEIISRVKNMKSHLADVKVKRKIEQPLYITIQCRNISHIMVCDDGIGI